MERAEGTSKFQEFFFKFAYALYSIRLATYLREALSESFKNHPVGYNQSNLGLIACNFPGLQPSPCVNNLNNSYIGCKLLQFNIVVLQIISFNFFQFICVFVFEVIKRQSCHHRPFVLKFGNNNYSTRYLSPLRKKYLNSPL